MPESTPNNIRKIVKEKASSVTPEDKPSGDDLKKKVSKTASTIKDQVVKVASTVKDPAVSTSILAAIAAGTGSAAYLHKQNKLDQIGPLGQTGIVVGSILIGVVNYFGFKTVAAKTKK